MSNRVDPQQLRERIELVSEQRYCTDPVCHDWVNSGESVKILVGSLLERSDQYHAALLKARLNEVVQRRITQQPHPTQSLSLAELLNDNNDENERRRAEWTGVGHYDGACPSCGRQRLMLCHNGMHRCEKCNWCPESGAYASVPAV